MLKDCKENCVKGHFTQHSSLVSVYSYINRELHKEAHTSPPTLSAPPSDKRIDINVIFQRALLC